RRESDGRHDCGARRCRPLATSAFGLCIVRSMHAHRIAQRLRAFFLTLCLVVGSQVLSWPHALAQSAVSETPDEQSRRAAEIYKTTMSPFCPGRTIDACPSPYATEWRDDIRQWVA